MELAAVPDPVGERTERLQERWGYTSMASVVRRLIDRGLDIEDPQPMERAS